MVKTALGAAVDDLVDELAKLAVARGSRLAVAESLTGGQLAAALAAAPDAGDWFRGGIVAYHPEVKYELLGAPRGPVVTAPTAEAMASSAARLLGADCSVAVTGVGGPEPDEGKPAGTVYLSTWRDSELRTALHRFPGEPVDVMRQTIEAALKALIARVRE